MGMFEKKPVAQPVAVLKSVCGNFLKVLSATCVKVHFAEKFFPAGNNCVLAFEGKKS